MKNPLKCLILFFFTQVQGYTQTPEQFLPDVMNNFPNTRDMCISPNGNEMYFTVQSYKKEFASIVYTTKNENGWNELNVAPFSGKYTDLEPALSADGLMLYFASNRPKNNTVAIADFDIWYVRRDAIDKNWSEPINIGAPINTTNDEFYPSITANGNLYFTTTNENSKGKEDIFISKMIDGKYQEPYSLPEAINTKGWEFNAFVAPDELYIIFSSTQHKNNVGGGDLYISFKDNENNWIDAVNLGILINSPKLDFCPFVDTKTNTLYYSSEKTSINKSFKDKQNLDELLNRFNTHPNGLSRIYTIPFENVTK